MCQLHFRLLSFRIFWMLAEVVSNIYPKQQQNSHSRFDANSTLISSKSTQWQTKGPVCLTERRRWRSDWLIGGFVSEPQWTQLRFASFSVPLSRRSSRFWSARANSRSLRGLVNYWRQRWIGPPPPQRLPSFPRFYFPFLGDSVNQNKRKNLRDAAKRIKYWLQK